jgi:acyl dehydratase
MEKTMNRSLIGKTYGPETYRVTAEAIRKYALATNDENPRYLDGGAREGIVAPPLFAVVPAGVLLITSLTDSELALPVDRTLHGEHDMEFLSPIRPGDVLVTEARIVAMDDVSTGEIVTFEIVSRTEAGQDRVRQRATAFVRDPQKRRSAGPASGEGPRRSELVAEQVMRVTEDQSYRYADASGDHNLPHVNEAVAKAIGFKTVILQGLCTMAFATKAVVDGVLEGDPSRLERIRVRFSKVVYPNDILTTRLWRHSAAGTLVFETTKEDGTVVIQDGFAKIRC